MKQIVAVLLVCLLCMSLLAPALAEPAKYATTRAFLAMMDEAEMTYTNRGLDVDNDEHIVIANPDKSISYTIHYFFEEDLEHTSMFAWNIITFDPADTLRVMYVCNSLNYDYNYTCWYVDETDNTVTCSMNLIYRDDNVGQVVTEATVYMMKIIEAAYPSLSPFNK